MTNHLSHQNDAGKNLIFEVFLKNITRSLPQYIFWKDKRSVYLGCNENFARLVGLSRPEDIIGKTDRDLNWQPTGHSAEEFIKGDQETLNGHPLTNREEILALPNGKRLITLVSKLPILDDNHHVLGIVGYFTDITSLKKKERALQQAKRQAEAANQAKSVFITNISHDLRTPLTGLLGMAEILQQEVQTAQGKAAAADLLKAGQVLLNLLNEVIEFSRCESGDLPVQAVKFDLPTAIQNIAELLKPSAEEKKLEFNTSFDKHLPRYVMGDAMRLQRILLNLLGNAIKFTHQGAVDFQVRIIHREERTVVLEFRVQDTGIGIPENQRALIFTRFCRLHPAYEGQYAGAGLGLTVVKRFVDELKGEIHVESIEDQGSTFSCLIPLRIPLSVGAEYAHPVTWLKLSQNNSGISFKTKSSSSEKAPLSVLVVEDHLIVQQVIKNLLQSLGMEVDIADNGAQALEKIQTRDYPLICMDLGLPDQNGYEVTTKIHQCQKLHKRPLSLIVALSAHLGEVEQQRCFSVGMIKAYEKPLTREAAEELLELIKKHINIEKISQSSQDPSHSSHKGNRHASH
jgi:two-component system aerobic respiration control sensor histidine kinase ArcB